MKFYKLCNLLLAAGFLALFLTNIVFGSKGNTKHCNHGQVDLLTSDWLIVSGVADVVITVFLVVNMFSHAAWPLVSLILFICSWSLTGLIKYTDPQSASCLTTNETTMLATSITQLILSFFCVLLLAFSPTPETNKLFLFLQTLGSWKEMSEPAKVKLCLTANAVLLLALVVLISIFADGRSEYWKIGPSNSLLVISVKIDTYGKYAALLGFIATIEAVRIAAEEVAMPILGFSVYNPDKKIIEVWSRAELRFCANLMFATTAVRTVLMTVISVTQVDLALFTVFVSQVVTIFTVDLLLKDKKFTNDKENNDGTTTELLHDLDESELPVVGLKWKMEKRKREK